MIKVIDNSKLLNEYVKAMNSGDPEQMQEAGLKLYTAICESVKQDVIDAKSADETDAILKERGVRQLTQTEKTFYQKWIESAKSSNPQQTFTDLIENDGMPETIIEDVYKNLTQEHPLLSRVNFVSVKYLTQWLLNNHAETMAQWGEITDEVVKEITSGFRMVEIRQSMLSAFLVIPKGLLDLGPQFLDSYVRQILTETIACGLEHGIISGKGAKGEIIGLIRDIHEGVTYSTTDGYPLKKEIAVDDFSPKAYGALVANLLKTEKGKLRAVKCVDLLVNPVDYLTKIMPATTVLTAQGTYSKDLFPFPTNVIPSIAVPENKAVMALLDEYFLGVGMDKNAAITYSDEYKFVQHARTYLAVLYAGGMASDNTVAQYLDLTNLSEAYITVLQKQVAAASNNETPTA